MSGENLTRQLVPPDGCAPSVARTILHVSSQHIVVLESCTGMLLLYWIQGPDLMPEILAGRGKQMLTEVRMQMEGQRTQTMQWSPCSRFISLIVSGKMCVMNTHLDVLYSTTAYNGAHPSCMCILHGLLTALLLGSGY